MQILKNEIREKILNAAKKEFKLKGYDKASMRNIADNADISVGNLYRYFTNKEELFEVVVSTPYNKITGFILENKALSVLDTEKDYVNFKRQFKLLANLFYNWKDEFLIIIYGSAGTKYDRAKETIIKLVEDKVIASMKVTLDSNSISKDTYYMAHIISVSLVEGLITIIKEQEDKNIIKEMVEKFIKFMFKNFYFRMPNKYK